MRHGGKVLIDQLEAQGVSTVFTVPGESFLAALDGLYDSNRIRTIVCRQEGGAAMMAEAWGKMTGAPGVCFVTPDYVAVGSDDDFFRLPLSPQSAVTIADAAGCTLLTARVSDAVWRAADLRLEPKPLTEDRESVATFWRHQQLIERQFASTERGQLTAGIKKDIVWTNRLRENPHKVAIYGWHYPDGRPIQSLYVGHRDRHLRPSGQPGAAGLHQCAARRAQRPGLHPGQGAEWRCL